MELLGLEELSNDDELLEVWGLVVTDRPTLVGKDVLSDSVAKELNVDDEEVAD